MPNLPIEWKTALEGLAPVEVVKRIEGLIVRGQTAPLSSDRESGPFLLFALGDTIEEVANKTGIPVDVVYLTAVKYHWEEKRRILTQKGDAQLITALQRQLINNLLIATHASILKQIGEVMSGKLAPENCPLIPRNLQGLKVLLEMVSEINKLVAANDNVSNSGTNVINAQNVQIVQPINSSAPQTDIIEEKRQKFLEMADQGD